MRNFRDAVLMLSSVVLFSSAACAKRVAPAVDTRPRPFQLVGATAERETARIQEQRDDVEIDTREFERIPKLVAQGETPLIHRDGGRARLFGDASATQGFSVDNVLLIEVLSEAGAVTDRAVVGFAEGVLIGAQRVDNIGTMGFTFEPGEIDIARILPESGAFKLRASVLDYNGVGKCSDIFVVLEPSASAESLETYRPEE